MKKSIVGMIVAVAIFAAPIAPAQAQVTGTGDAATIAAIEDLRAELIQLLLQLIAQLQTQLDAQAAQNVEQEEEIEVIKTKVASSTPVVVEKERVDPVAAAREKVGEPWATASIEEDEGEFFANVSVTRYLDTDSVIVSSNATSTLSEEQSCSGSIADSQYKSCAHYFTYAVPQEGSELIITVSVNGIKKDLVVEYGSGVKKVTWPQ